MSSVMSSVESSVAESSVESSVAESSVAESSVAESSVESSYRLPQLSFDYDVSKIETVTQQTITELEDKYHELEAISLTDVTFNTVIEEFSLALAKASTQMAPILFLQHVSENKAIRDASQDAEDTYTQFINQTFMRSELYLRFKQIDPSELDSQQLKLLTDYLLQFKHTGIELSVAERAELSQLITEMDNLCLKFSANLNDDETHLILKPEELEGLDVDFLSRTKIVDLDAHKITHKYPDVNPILDYCSVTATREKIANMRANRCAPNLEILEKLHRLRLQIANKLGYASHVDIQLSDQMMTEGLAVGNFLKTILKELEPTTRKYIETLAEMKNTEHQPDYYKRSRRGLGIADYPYYHNRYLKEHYQVDHQIIKEYFPAEQVIKAMMNFYAHMFALNFVAYKFDQPLPTNWNNLGHSVAQPWHSDVLTYLVEDSEHQPMGYVYMDLYPRDGKYTHYAMWNLIDGYQFADSNPDQLEESGKYCQVLPVACLVGNFPEPVGDKPSLLDLSEVETMFHEFGHVLHGICGGARNKYVELSGTNTETDFVEAPSQMKEQWVYEPEILKFISLHYKTGQHLPEYLIQSIVASRHIGVSYNWSRIVSMALVDWEIHQVNHTYNYQMMVELMEKTMIRSSHHAYTSGRSIATWGHIGSQDYSGRYYSYVLTMVLACDLYSRFAGNPINPKIGLEYRQKILSPGGTKLGTEMIHDFLGRDPTLYSFLKNFVGVESKTNPEDLKFKIK